MSPYNDSSSNILPRFKNLLVTHRWLFIGGALALLSLVVIFSIVISKSNPSSGSSSQKLPASVLEALNDSLEAPNLPDTSTSGEGSTVAGLSGTKVPDPESHDLAKGNPISGPSKKSSTFGSSKKSSTRDSSASSEQHSSQKSHASQQSSSGAENLGPNNIESELNQPKTKPIADSENLSGASSTHSALQFSQPISSGGPFSTSSGPISTSGGILPPSGGSFSTSKIPPSKYSPNDFNPILDWIQKHPNDNSLPNIIKEHSQWIKHAFYQGIQDDFTIIKRYSNVPVDCLLLLLQAIIVDSVEQNDFCALLKVTLLSDFNNFTVQKIWTASSDDYPDMVIPRVAENIRELHLACGIETPKIDLIQHFASKKSDLNKLPYLDFKSVWYQYLILGKNDQLDDFNLLKIFCNNVNLYVLRLMGSFYGKFTPKFFFKNCFELDWDLIRVYISCRSDEIKKLKDDELAVIVRSHYDKEVKTAYFRLLFPFFIQKESVEKLANELFSIATLPDYWKVQDLSTIGVFFPVSASNTATFYIQTGLDDQLTEVFKLADVNRIIPSECIKTKFEGDKFPESTKYLFQSCKKWERYQGSLIKNVDISIETKKKFIECLSKDQIPYLFRVSTDNLDLVRWIIQKYESIDIFFTTQFLSLIIRAIEEDLTDLAALIEESIKNADFTGISNVEKSAIVSAHMKACQDRKSDEYLLKILKFLNSKNLLTSSNLSVIPLKAMPLSLDFLLETLKTDPKFLTEISRVSQRNLETFQIIMDKNIFTDYSDLIQEYQSLSDAALKIIDSKNMYEKFDTFNVNDVQWKVVISKSDCVPNLLKKFNEKLKLAEIKDLTAYFVLEHLILDPDLTDRLDAVNEENDLKNLAKVYSTIIRNLTGEKLTRVGNSAMRAFLSSHTNYPKSISYLLDRVSIFTSETMKLLIETGNNDPNLVDRILNCQLSSADDKDRIKELLLVQNLPVFLTIASDIKFGVPLDVFRALTPENFKKHPVQIMELILAHIENFDRDQLNQFFAKIKNFEKRKVMWIQTLNIKFDQIIEKLGTDENIANFLDLFANLHNPKYFFGFLVQKNTLGPQSVAALERLIFSKENVFVTEEIIKAAGDDETYKKIFQECFGKHSECRLSLNACNELKRYGDDLFFSTFHHIETAFGSSLDISNQDLIQIILHCQHWKHLQNILNNLSLKPQLDSIWHDNESFKDNFLKSPDTLNFLKEYLAAANEKVLADYCKRGIAIDSGMHFNSFCPGKNALVAGGKIGEYLEITEQASGKVDSSIIHKCLVEIGSGITSNTAASKLCDMALAQKNEPVISALLFPHESFFLRLSPEKMMQLFKACSDSKKEFFLPACLKLSQAINNYLVGKQWKPALIVSICKAGFHSRNEDIFKNLCPINLFVTNFDSVMFSFYEEAVKSSKGLLSNHFTALLDAYANKATKVNYVEYCKLGYQSKDNDFFTRLCPITGAVKAKWLDNPQYFQFLEDHLPRSFITGSSTDSLVGFGAEHWLEILDFIKSGIEKEEIKLYVRAYFKIGSVRTIDVVNRLSLWTPKFEESVPNLKQQLSLFFKSLFKHYPEDLYVQDLLAKLCDYFDKKLNDPIVYFDYFKNLKACKNEVFEKVARTDILSKFKSKVIVMWIFENLTQFANCPHSKEILDLILTWDDYIDEEAVEKLCLQSGNTELFLNIDLTKLNEFAKILERETIQNWIKNTVSSDTFNNKEHVLRAIEQIKKQIEPQPTI